MSDTIEHVESNGIKDVALLNENERTEEELGMGFKTNEELVGETADITSEPLQETTHGDGKSAIENKVEAIEKEDVLTNINNERQINIAIQDNKEPKSFKCKDPENKMQCEDAQFTKINEKPCTETPTKISNLPTENEKIDTTERNSNCSSSCIEENIIEHATSTTLESRPINLSTTTTTTKTTTSLNDIRNSLQHVLEKFFTKSTNTSFKTGDYKTHIHGAKTALQNIVSNLEEMECCNEKRVEQIDTHENSLENGALDTSGGLLKNEKADKNIIHSEDVKKKDFNDDNKGENATVRESTQNEGGTMIEVTENDNSTNNNIKVKKEIDTSENEKTELVPLRRSTRLRRRNECGTVMENQETVEKVDSDASLVVSNSEVDKGLQNNKQLSLKIKNKKCVRHNRIDSEEDEELVDTRRSTPKHKKKCFGIESSSTSESELENKQHSSMKPKGTDNNRTSADSKLDNGIKRKKRKVSFIRESSSSSSQEIEEEVSTSRKTPLKSNTNIRSDEGNNITPKRSSERIRGRNRHQMRPTREAVFKEIDALTPSKDNTSKLTSKFKIFGNKSRNNFIKCRSTYNSEKRGTYAEDSYESDDGFIDDTNLGEEVDKKPRSVKKKSKKKRKNISDEESDTREGGSNNGNRSKQEDITKTDSNKNEDTSVRDDTATCSKYDNSDTGIASNRKLQYRSQRIRSNNDKLSKLQRLKKLRNSSKVLTLKEREEILKDSSDEGNYQDTGDNSPNRRNSFSSDESHFIVHDSEESTQNEDSDIEPSQENISKSKTKTPKSTSTPLKRVVLQESDLSDSNLEQDIVSNVAPISNTEKEFFKAIRTSNVEVVRHYLKENNNISNTFDENRDTPLHLAACQRNHFVLTALLEYNADPNLKSLNTNTSPLVEAALSRDPDCFEILLQASDINKCHESLYKQMDGKNLLHLLVSSIPTKDDIIVSSSDVMSSGDVISSDNIKNSGDTQSMQNFDEVIGISKIPNVVITRDDIKTCIEILKNFDELAFRKYTFERNKESHIPLLTAIKEGCVQGVISLMYEMFASDKHNCFNYVTDQGGNLIHFAVQYSAECLKEVLSYVSSKVNEKDLNGYTPLMYAAELGKCDCLGVLHEFGASIDVEANLVTPLHLAAGAGNLECIRFLLRCGHSVLKKDQCGWPPLLYANFQSDKECVVSLFEKDPSQLFCLSELISGNNDEMTEKNKRVIQKTLENISHFDAYYTLFNNFISKNFSLLDSNNSGVFIVAWKRILSFKNKVRWLRERCSHYVVENSTYVKVDRNCVLKSAMKCLPSYTNYSLELMDVSFKDEAGRCLGPKREFITRLVQDITDKKNLLFTSFDNNKTFRPFPNTYFLLKMKKSDTTKTENRCVSTGTKSHNQQKNANGKGEEFENVFAMDHYDDNSFCNDLDELDNTEHERRLSEIHEQLRFLGRFVATIVLSETNIKLQFTNSFLKKILGIPLKHPECFSDEDFKYFSNIKDNDLTYLDVPFTASCMNPWTERLEEIFLTEDHERLVCEKTKDEYLELLSKFLYQDVIEKEVSEFRYGFYQRIPHDDIKMFTADEFSLLLNGVTTIDVDDWERNTTYFGGWKKDSEIIRWFWRLVRSLKEEEKSLLLKFVTGSPCVPIGGFAKLSGLGGDNGFKIKPYPGFEDKLPGASTCFNILKLPVYSSEETLRNKVLIAVRHGCEGFAFS